MALDDVTLFLVINERLSDQCVDCFLCGVERQAGGGSGLFDGQAIDGKVQNGCF
jgi:hypothetical protein